MASRVDLFARPSEFEINDAWKGLRNTWGKAKQAAAELTAPMPEPDMYDPNSLPNEQHAGEGLARLGKAYLSLQPDEEDMPVIGQNPDGTPMRMDPTGMMGVMGAVKKVSKAAGKKVASGALDMSEAARMARAKGMGFDTGETYYHGTSANIKSFDPEKSASGVKYGKGTYVTNDPQHAQLYTTGYPDGYDGVIPTDLDGGNILPVHARAVKTLNLEETLPREFGEALWSELPAKLKKVADKEQYLSQYPGRSLLEMAGTRGVTPTKITELAQKYGYDSIKHKDELVLFESNQIRSKFAAFDPKKKASGNLSAGVAGAGLVGAAALAGSSDANASDLFAPPSKKERADFMKSKPTSERTRK